MLFKKNQFYNSVLIPVRVIVDNWTSVALSDLGKPPSGVIWINRQHVETEPVQTSALNQNSNHSVPVIVGCIHKNITAVVIADTPGEDLHSTECIFVGQLISALQLQ